MHQVIVEKEQKIDKSTQKRLEILTQAAADKKAEYLRIYQTSELCSYADFIIISSANSVRHAISIAENILREGKKHQIKPMGVEGLDFGNWILIDYGDIIFHVFYHPVRLYYELDRLWEGAPLYKIPNVTDESELPPPSGLELDLD